MKTRILFSLSALTFSSLYSQISEPDNFLTFPASYVGWSNANALNFKTNGIQHMTLTTTGRLGLGLTAPVAQLHLARNTSSLGSLLRTEGLNID
jgi:hypothetical protein